MIKCFYQNKKLKEISVDISRRSNMIGRNAESGTSLKFVRVISGKTQLSRGMASNTGLSLRCLDKYKAVVYEKRELESFNAELS